jgi:ribulose-5-phosphate 4-epimerase/fuculose-1-phosphate aldolase
MITAIGDVMRQCYTRGWITTRDGNFSLRKKDSSFLYLTPSGVRKNKIEVESIIKIPIKGGALHLPEGPRPSGELQMHWNIQKVAIKTTAVLHVHPTHIIAAMYAGWDLQELARQFPELGRYTSVAPTVPILPATSVVLGDVTYEHLIGMGYAPPPNGKIYDIVGQENHGVCAVAGDPWSAYEHVERLNHVCEIVLASGIKPS